MRGLYGRKLLGALYTPCVGMEVMCYSNMGWTSGSGVGSEVVIFDFFLPLNPSLA